MAFIGNTVQNQGFTPAIDYFNGNGVTVTFTLSRPIASVAQVIVAVDNVIQNPSSAFGVVGNSITFTSAPLSGTNNIWVEYTSLITTYQGISQDPTVIGDIRATGGYLAEGDFGNSFIDGNLIDYVTGRGRFTVGELDDITFYHGGTGARSEMMDLYYAGGAKIYGTTALTIPVGTTGQRPGTPATGMIRYNTTESSYEVYASSGWRPISTTKYSYSVTYLVVAGGGGGGGGSTIASGGGGAGGFLTSTATLTPGSVYTVTVGGGGSPSTNGSNSVLSGANITTVTSIGGGCGGEYGNPQGQAGASGGSGGGSGFSQGGTFQSGGSGTLGQGNSGGNTLNQGASGGGGGASAAGGNASGGTAGNGGNGSASSITGSSVTYAGGGGGGTESSPGGTGGSGGGGNGSTRSPYSVGSNGTANTGGGGGGGENSNKVTFSGGSGVVILSILTLDYTGTTTGSPTVTTSGANTILQFNSSGSYTA